jgi:hypothetical protein
MQFSLLAEVFDTLRNSNMIKSESNFNKNIEIIELSKDVSITLTAFPNVKNFPCDIIISGFGKEKKIQNFAWIESAITGKEKVKFVPKLYYVIKQNDKSFLAIVGLNEVVFVNSSKESIVEIVQLNRRETDDQGFYKIDILLLESSFIIIYEGGVVRINNDGVILWHTFLMWDDIYLRADENFLYYWSEFGEFALSEWVVSIKSGEKHQIN